MNANSRIETALLQTEPALSTPLVAEALASMRPVLAWRLDPETGRPVAIWVLCVAPR
jgi:hypothetical protein